MNIYFFFLLKKGDVLGIEREVYTSAGVYAKIWLLARPFPTTNTQFNSWSNKRLINVYPSRAISACVTPGSTSELAGYIRLGTPLGKAGPFVASPEGGASLLPFVPAAEAAEDVGGRLFVTVVVAASGSVSDWPPGPVALWEGRLATARELSVSTKLRSELMDTLGWAGVGEAGVGLGLVVGGGGGRVDSGSRGGEGVARSGALEGRVSLWRGVGGGGCWEEAGRAKLDDVGVARRGAGSVERGGGGAGSVEVGGAALDEKGGTGGAASVEVGARRGGAEVAEVAGGGTTDRGGRPASPLLVGPRSGGGEDAGGRPGSLLVGPRRGGGADAEDAGGGKMEIGGRPASLLVGPRRGGAEEGAAASLDVVDIPGRGKTEIWGVPASLLVGPRRGGAEEGAGGSVEVVDIPGRGKTEIGGEAAVSLVVAGVVPGSEEGGLSAAVVVGVDTRGGRREREVGGTAVVWAEGEGWDELGDAGSEEDGVPRMLGMIAAGEEDEVVVVVVSGEGGVEEG